jgi:hypothetical protein
VSKVVIFFAGKLRLAFHAASQSAVGEQSPRQMQVHDLRGNRFAGGEFG